MDSFASRVGYFLSQPQKVIYAVATALLYPVLFLEVAALLWVAFKAGSLTVEAWKRRKIRRNIDLETASANLAAATAAADTTRMGAVLSLFNYGPVIGPAVQRLAAHGLSHVRAVKYISDAEQTAARRLDRTRIFIRIGPMLGLMGTLIPISPALVGLAKGDTQTLATNLVVAFSTTVVGLLIGGIAYLVSLIRERMYTQDLSDLEYVLERSEV